MAKKPKEDDSEEPTAAGGEVPENPDAEEIREMLFNAQVELTLLHEALLAVQAEQVRQRAVQEQLPDEVETDDSTAKVDKIERKFLRRLVELQQREPLPEDAEDEAELAEKLGQLDDSPKKPSN